MLLNVCSVFGVIKMAVFLLVDIIFCNVMIGLCK